MIEGNKKEYDLEERTAKFGEKCILLCKKVQQDTITRPIISQLVRSSTSVGANYMEANGASSKKDFKNKIHICKKEVQESKHWLHMVSVAQPEIKQESRKIWKEAQELTLIFGKIVSKLRE